MRVAPILTPTIAVAILLVGCSQPALRPSFVNGTPEERTMAAMDAVRTDDASKVPQLITMLDSEDPAERMIASDALFRLTGQSNGYNYADPEPLRSEAVARWRRWYLDRRGVGTGTES
jgi:hypothetical protein